MILALLIATIPLLALWRFGNLPLDRDYAPYAYPAVYGTPYLKAGHADIKPPLIHWSYKLWLNTLSILRCKWSLNVQLRGMNAVIASVAVFATSYGIGPKGGMLLALLLTSPTLWAHMAQTEILSVCLGALALFLPSPWDWLALGLLPWANQKNLLLGMFLLPMKSWPVSQEIVALVLPSLLFLSYLAATSRLKLAKTWLWDIPKEFGKTRTFRVNTLSAARLLIPCLALFAVPIASMEYQSPWALLALIVAGGMVGSRQIVPHHFLLLALPVALASNMSVMAWVGFALIFAFRDGLCWWNPKVTYAVTFPGYQELMEESRPIEKWLIDNAQGETIWIDGMENHIIFASMKMVTRIEIPELKGVPTERPKYVVWTYGFKRENGKPVFDYEGYEPVDIPGLHGPTTKNGRYTLLRRVD